MNRLLLAAAIIMAGVLLLFLNAHAAPTPSAAPTPDLKTQLNACEQEKQYYLGQRDQLEAALLRLQVQKTETKKP